MPNDLGIWQSADGVNSICTIIIMKFWPPRARFDGRPVEVILYFLLGGGRGGGGG